MDPANVRDGKVYFEGLPTSPFRIEGIDEYTVLQGKIRDGIFKARILEWVAIS